MCTDAETVINKKQKRNKTSATASQSTTRTTTKTTTTKTTKKPTTSSFYSSSLSSTALTGHKSGLKWKIIISSILLLLCRISHVLAIRKGRLMSPSSFTALSGDLHVQIQFSAEDVDFDTKLTTPITTTTRTTTTTTTSTSTTTTGRSAGNQAESAATQTATASNIENTITTTLVISKYVDDLLATTTSSSQPSSAVSNEVFPAAGYSSSNFNYSSLPVNASQEQLLQRRRKEIVQNIPLYPDPRHNVTQIAVPCQTFMQGGLYEMQVVTNLKTSRPQTSSGVSTGATPTLTTTTLMPVIDERLRQTLDVRWPAAEMRISPVRLKTYPEQPVEVELRFPEVDCDKAWLSHNLPEFWLELIYCGKERTCAQISPQNISKSAILYAEQIRGYPKKKSLKLGCELFGLAGNYAVQLRPMLASARHVPVTRRFLSVDWSDKFVFNVYARSIFPCDPHTGIGVLYEYPACILEQGDRVRVYAKLRADVASLKPPTTLHYVAEQRVVKSQYSLYFNCDLFSEKFVEYCFVYVSQAISGAVADVRMDCVPTLPVRDSDTGSWGPWSEWTPCSTNCLGGTRNRYRFCDSPPPRYGAKFCEGASVETQKCGQSIGDTWDCIYESSGTQATKVNRTEVSQEIGPGCRCGCIVHLGSSKPKRIIAGATQSCPGRSFWLLQVDGQETIGLALNFLRLPCVTQYIKVRDGPSLSSTLLIELKGGNNLILPAALESTSAQLLVEFYAGDVGTTNTNNNHGAQSVAQLLTNNTSAAAGVASSMSCTGGFLANVEQIGLKNASSMDEVATTRIASVKSRVVVPKVQRLRSGFTLVHLSAVVFASIIILISALLGAQYVLRYRKYHLAVARRRDEGSRLHTPRTSLSSLHLPPSRAVSTTTLISEVIYLVKMRPKHKLRHSILRESVDAEALARETEFDGCEALAQMTKCDEGSSSSGSIATLCNAQTATMKRNDDYVPKSLELASHSGTLTRKISGKDSDSIISSGMSSLCNSPPLQAKRASRYSERYDAATLKMRADYGGQDCESPRSSCMRDYERLSQLGRVGRSASVSLTNGCYSPAASVVSTATIRTSSASTNPKESKEKQNRKKLLARPGSEFSLGNQEDLELDYYDYNVDNAGATPGSYLGMDPAYLIWIPPFDDVGEDIDADNDDDDENKKSPEAASEHEPLYQEIKMPRYGHYLSPGSNTETNSSPSVSTFDELSPLSSQQQSKASSPSDTHNLKNCLIQKAITNSSNNNNNMSRPATPRLTRKQRRAAKKHCQSTMSLRTEDAVETFALHELSGTKSARSIAAVRTATTPSPEADEQSDSYVEKETTVVKSPSDMQDFLALDDIQFADESENSDHDVARELELKLREQTQVSAKQLRAKRVEASSMSGMREVTV